MIVLPEMIFFVNVIGEPKSNDAISNMTFIYFNCQQDGKINIPAKATRRWKATTLFKIVFTNLHTLHALRLDQICGGSFYLSSLFAIHCAYHLRRYLLCSIDVDDHNLCFGEIQGYMRQIRQLYICQNIF